MAAMPCRDRNCPPRWFDRLGSDCAATPLVLSVPHAGRFYPDRLRAESIVPAALLEDLEDRHADQFVAAAVAAGAIAIVARGARAWIDLNRGEDDLDPALRDPPGSGPPATARARAGLGLLPQRLGRRALWRAAPAAAEAAARIAAVHRPYHAAIAGALEEARLRHGFAILLDCHSMPPLAGPRPAQIVLGDRHGHSAAPGLAAQLAAVARAAGFRTALNAPYAGAHAIERHGRPDRAVHAVQIEIDRSLYLAADMRTISAGLEPVRALIAALGTAAIRAVQSPPAVAAE